MGFTGKIANILPTMGLNNSKDPLLIDPKQSPGCKNVRFRNESVSKRDGISRYLASAPAAAAGTGLYEFALDAGTLNQIVCLSNNKVYKRNGAGWTDITGAVTITNAATSFWSWVTLADLMVGFNGVDVPVKWTGAGNLAALGGSPPSAKYAAVYKNYVVTLLGTKVQWSDLNAPETWPAANFNLLLNKGGQYGTGFGRIGDQLFVFFDQSINQLAYTGNAVTPFTFPVSSPNIGCIAPQAIVGVQDWLFFPSSEGIQRFDGSQVQCVSQDVEGTWRTANLAQAALMTAIHNPRYNEIYFSFPTGGGSTCDTTLCYDYRNNKWSPFIGWVPRLWANFRRSLPIDPVFVDAGGVVMQANSGAYNDDGVAIDWYCLTKPTDFEDPGRKKKVRRMKLALSSDSLANASITVKTGYDLAPVGSDKTISVTQSGSLWDAFTWDVDSWVNEAQIPVMTEIGGSGNYFQAQLSNSILNQSANVSEMDVFVKGEVAEQ